ncbi:DUF3224 domain-containing protein [Pseudoduganella namucuonensis]|uniref:DUF3224 domain-containing protein n=1 Tax=Pseudoduganella namucuonensis TaxID=1035707 RepID=A0A1I7LJJ1_9BURK|nr:DUF3224 domain-containing protein [Pseudoduganella namucuonensis]SFV09872.1 Protein of unknown function [Pseudoduganella namucuonensis]
MPVAAGEFDVTMTPELMSVAASGFGLGRMVLDKRYHGALDATGNGEMLSFRGAAPDSAGYVAMERVEGVLDGLKGGFTIQHHGIMNRGAPALMVTVVPDSGSGDLTGLSGTLEIRIEEGRHYYAFDYALAPIA